MENVKQLSLNGLFRLAIVKYPEGTNYINIYDENSELIGSTKVFYPLAKKLIENHSVDTFEMKNIQL